MKLLTLAINNIRSFKGDGCHIDFTGKPFARGRVSWIYGPTGSGLTTLIDCLCLALYGKLPNQQELPAADELISHQSRSCFAEVQFTMNGEDYKARWQYECRATTGKSLSSGQTMVLTSNQNGRCLARNADVPTTITTMTGMDIGRFCYSQMLSTRRLNPLFGGNREQRMCTVERMVGYYEASYQALVKANRVYILLIQEWLSGLFRESAVAADFTCFLNTDPGWRTLTEKMPALSNSIFRERLVNFILERIVTYANEYLNRLNQRFVIIINENKSIELDVKARYPGSSQLGINSLSEGSLWLISLVLALAVVKFNTSKDTTSTLFVDEALGLVDEPHLKTVIEILNDICCVDRNIVLLSNVMHLDRHIKHRLDITQTHDGYSRLFNDREQTQTPQLRTHDVDGAH